MLGQATRIHTVDRCIYSGAPGSGAVPRDTGTATGMGDSLAGMMGHTTEPVIKPLGFNWKIGIGLLSSLAAREVIVGTLGTIYGIEGTAESQGLQKALQSDLTPAGAVALL